MNIFIKAYENRENGATFAANVSRRTLNHLQRRASNGGFLRYTVDVYGETDAKANARGILAFFRSVGIR